jgi:MOSC domain-containing protein YiiM
MPTTSGCNQRLAALETGLEHIRSSPSDEGVVRLLVRRPAVDEREVLAEAMLDAEAGLVGDGWSTRGRANPDLQLTLMNARVAELVAGSAERWSLAGDQLYVDLSLSTGDLPAGTRLAVGSALIEVTDEPHRGCGKFAARFGVDALRFVNSKVGRELNLRGVNARVLSGGVVRRGDAIRRAADG